MFKQSLIIIALASSAAGVFANEYTDASEFTPNFTSTKTRAEVRAEFDAARKAGEIPVGELGAPADFVNAKSTKTRAEVQAELAAYVKSGQRDRDTALHVGGGN